jgi:putative ABC transport system permease protein
MRSRWPGGRRASDRSNDRFIPYMFGGITLLGIGVILAVPILVRLLADVLVRRTGHPGLVIAGRRLQARTAAMTRVVAGLLVGLFVVTGARAVVVAFEQTAQYQSAVRMKTTGLVASLDTSAHHAAAAQQAVRRLDEIRVTTLLPTLTVRCDDSDGPCMWGVVATWRSCARRSTVFPAAARGGPCG